MRLKPRTKRTSQPLNSQTWTVHQAPLLDHRVSIIRLVSVRQYVISPRKTCPLEKISTLMCIRKILNSVLLVVSGVLPPQLRLKKNMMNLMTQCLTWQHLIIKEAGMLTLIKQKAVIHKLQWTITALTIQQVCMLMKMGKPKTLGSEKKR